MEKFPNGSQAFRCMLIVEPWRASASCNTYKYWVTGLEVVFITVCQKSLKRTKNNSDEKKQVHPSWC